MRTTPTHTSFNDRVRAAFVATDARRARRKRQISDVATRILNTTSHSDIDIMSDEYADCQLADCAEEYAAEYGCSTEVAAIALRLAITRLDNMRDDAEIRGATP